MIALDGFGFTRALIFPYHKLDFLPLGYLSGTWAGMRTPSDPAPAGQKCSISLKTLSSTPLAANSAAAMHLSLCSPRV
jgi:hypothetical protein